MSNRHLSRNINAASVGPVEYFSYQSLQLPTHYSSQPMNDDKTRPRLSLKRKAPPADTFVPASEAGADITVSRRKTVVVNTGPKRNKKPLADDRPPASRMPQPGNGQPKKTKKKSSPRPTQKGGGGERKLTLSNVFFL